ncbi:BQ5605_C013g07291 [Microbotryum silenes-dioicae]|uniref:BQ5605_C013g07291 protein n=1 Tax=Microbotryum silenes-dioicae TaxID=796604 RepID=A0A2X0LVL6_9BASI|nr:BQ5605_C013g07291 [Microbotryum silenes-dioicae]
MPSPRIAAATTHSSVRLWSVLAGGAALRLALSTTSLPEILQDRNELVTPITSFTRCKHSLHWSTLQEGFYLVNTLKQDPYLGGSFHHPPLLLLLSQLVSPKTRPLFAHLAWTATDLVTAYYLARVAQRRSKEAVLKDDEQLWSPSSVAALYVILPLAEHNVPGSFPSFFEQRYCLHPFSIATGLSLSTQVFSHHFVVLALLSAIQGTSFSTLPFFRNAYSAVFAISIASHFSLYPVLLLPPLVVLAHRQNPRSTSIARAAIFASAAFVSHQAVVLGLSYYLAGSWNFFSSVYGVILTIPDLTPNIGISWYFFIEMFDHFRAFFVGVFQIHVLIYVAPLTFAFRSDPMFTLVLMVGIIALFKSYTALGDFALWHAVLALYSELASHITRPLVYFGLTLYALALLPSFHHLWLYSGSGNANFFYASTLVWAIGQGGLLIEVLDAKLKREVVNTLDEQGRELVKKGRWRVLQRVNLVRPSDQSTGKEDEIPTGRKSVPLGSIPSNCNMRWYAEQRTTISSLKTDGLEIIKLPEGNYGHAALAQDTAQVVVTMLGKIVAINPSTGMPPVYLRDADIERVGRPELFSRQIGLELATQAVVHSYGFE